MKENRIGNEIDYKPIAKALKAEIALLKDDLKEDITITSKSSLFELERAKVAQ